MKKLRVLIIDDVASMRKFAKFGLEKSFPSILVEEAANGKEAQMKLEHSEYDLVLCDWEMPDITGDEVLHWIRKHPAMSATPFIMVTSRNDRSSVLKAIESGANAYVIKPYTAEILAQKITAVIDKFDRRQFERYTATGGITVHFREFVARGTLIDLSRGGLLSSFSRKNTLPSIFEKVLIDIKLEDAQKANGIEAFVIRIQAAEAFIDAEEVRLAFKFLDFTPEQEEEITRLLTSLKKLSPSA